jgi:hypothetical protein
MQQSLFGVGVGLESCLESVLYIMGTYNFSLSPSFSSSSSFSALNVYCACLHHEIFYINQCWCYLACAWKGERLPLQKVQRMVFRLVKALLFSILASNWKRWFWYIIQMSFRYIWSSKPKSRIFRNLQTKVPWIFWNLQTQVRNLVIKVTSFFRLGLGLGYRLTWSGYTGQYIQQSLLDKRISFSQHAFREKWNLGFTCTVFFPYCVCMTFEVTFAT